MTLIKTLITLYIGTTLNNEQHIAADTAADTVTPSSPRQHNTDYTEAVDIYAKLHISSHTLTKTHTHTHTQHTSTLYHTS